MLPEKKRSPCPSWWSIWESQKRPAEDAGDRSARRPTLVNGAIAVGQASEDMQTRLMKKRSAEEEAEDERLLRQQTSRSDDVPDDVMGALEVMEEATMRIEVSGHDLPMTICGEGFDLS